MKISKKIKSCLLLLFCFAVIICIPIGASKIAYAKPINPIEIVEEEEPTTPSSPANPNNPSGNTSGSGSSDGSNGTSGNNSGESESSGNGSETNINNDSSESSSDSTGESTYIIDYTCKHSWIQIKRIEPRCETTGSVSYECSNCGSSKIEYLEPLGHNWVNDTVDPVKLDIPCGTEYNDSETCTRCKMKLESFLHVYRPEGHEVDYSKPVTVRKANCLTEYTVKYTCYYCKTNVSEPKSYNSHNYVAVYDVECLNPTTVINNNGITVLAPGYDENGEIVYKRRRAINCNANLARNSKQMNTYEFLKNSDIYQPETCGEIGICYYMCLNCYEDGTICGAIQMEEGTNYPVVGESTPLSHNYDWTFRQSENVEASCTTSGVQYGKCKNCGNEVRHIVSALGHNYVTKKGDDGKLNIVCSRCGKDFNPRLEANKGVFEAYKNIFKNYGKYIFIVLGSVITVWGAYLGIRIAIAKETEEKKHAKRMLLNSFIGLVIIAALLAIAIPVLDVIINWSSV